MMKTEIAIQNKGLTKSEISLSPSLNDREKKLVKAVSSSRCMDLINRKAPDVVVELTKAINRMQAVTGFKKGGEAGEDVQMTMIKEMVEVVKRYKWMRIDELKFITSEGMIGEYGEFYSFDARTLNGWIKSYYDKERGKALKKQLEFEQKQQSIEEESRRKRDQEQAVKSNRQQFVKAYLSLAEKHAEAIEAGELTYVSIPQEIDPKNVLFYAFQKKWDNTLGFPVQVLKDILAEELKREKVRISQTGDWIKMKDEQAIMAGAQSNARNRTFRMRIANMLLSGEDIEAFIKEHDI